MDNANLVDPGTLSRSSSPRLVGQLLSFIGRRFEPLAAKNATSQRVNIYKYISITPTQLVVGLTADRGMPNSVAELIQHIRLALQTLIAQIAATEKVFQKNVTFRESLPEVEVIALVS